MGTFHGSRRLSRHILSVASVFLGQAEERVNCLLICDFLSVYVLSFP